MGGSNGEALFINAGFDTLQNIETVEDSGTTPHIHLRDKNEPGVLECRMRCPYVFAGGTLSIEAFTETSEDTILIEFSKDQSFRHEIAHQL